MSHPFRDCTILLIDDEEANLDLLEAFLEAEGYRSLERTADPGSAVEYFDRTRPDLVLLDLHMPFRDGFEILADIRERTPPDDYLPVLILTADVTSDARERALSGGARDFITKPFDAVEVLLRVRNLLETRLMHRAQREARMVAEAAERRARLLAEAGRVLGASLDSATALSQLTQVLVPTFADACAIALRDGDRPNPVGMLASDPSLADRLSDAIGASASPDDPPWPSENGAARDRLRTELRVRNEVVGEVVLLRSTGSVGFDGDDLALIEAIAARSALAVENARLFAGAQAATRLRDRMLSVVAHDLRNPLALVAMNAEMLLEMIDPDADPYQLEMLSSLERAASRMQRLVEDLLDMSGIEQGGLSVQPSPCSLESLCREAIASATLAARGAGISLAIEVQRELPFVMADDARLLQVLSNLIGNALKFTPAGGVVTLVCERIAGDVRVSVRDTGSGIPADQVPHVFGAFWQARDADRRGVGLGLWIARTIVESHGGRIWVESREGEGSTFTFTIPVAAPPMTNPNNILAHHIIAESDAVRPQLKT
jgi:signal transduction histidine kinase